MWWQTNLKFLLGNFVKTSLHLRCRGMAQGVKCKQRFPTESTLYKYSAPDIKCHISSPKTMQHGVKATGWPFQGGGGRVLPCINHTGMCHPKGWHILVWNRAGFGELGGTPHQEFPGVHPHPLTIFPNLCLWQCSLFSNFGGIDHEKNFSGRACLQTTPPPPSLDKAWRTLQFLLWKVVKTLVPHLQVI